MPALYNYRFHKFPPKQLLVSMSTLIFGLLLSCVLAEGILRTFPQTSLSHAQAIATWTGHLGIRQGDIPMWKSIILGLIASLLLTRSAIAQSCTAYPNPLTNGTTANGSDVIGDMTYMSGCLAPLANPVFEGGSEAGVTIATFDSTTTSSSGSGLRFSNSGTTMM